MKTYRTFVVATAVLFSISGCVTPQGEPDNTASGALAGGAMGAIIGSTARNPGAGAAVGAAVGAVAGGAVGHSIDQAQAAQRAQTRRYRETQPVTIDDVVAMTKAQIGDDLIIGQIRNSRTIYHLKSADIISLKRSGVSERVIDFMINTPTEITTAETADTDQAPPPPLVEPVVVAPGPGYFWISGSWLWLNNGWIWRHGYWRGPYHSGFYHFRHGRYGGPR